MSPVFAEDTEPKANIEAYVSRNVESKYKNEKNSSNNSILKTTAESLVCIPLLPISIIVTPITFVSSWFIIYNETKKNPELRMFVGM